METVSWSSKNIILTKKIVMVYQYIPKIQIFNKQHFSVKL